MTEPVSNQRTADQLRQLGVTAGDVLVVHTSYRAIGPVEGGPAGLIRVLVDLLGPSGTLVMPAMSASRRRDPFDPSTSETWHMGIVPETFWRMPGVLRSSHPTSSFAAQGPHAAEITAPQSLTPIAGLDSPIGRAYELDGSVLLLGVGHDKSTTVHVAEALAGVPYRTTGTAYVLRDGQPALVEYEETDSCTRNFQLLDEWLRERGLQREGPVGHGQARLAKARAVVETASRMLREEPLLFLCPVDAGCETCDAGRSAAAAAPST